MVVVVSISSEISSQKGKEMNMRSHINLIYFLIESDVNKYNYKITDRMMFGMKLIIVHHLKFVFLWNFADAHASIVAERCENPWINIRPFNTVDRIFVLVVCLQKTVRYSVEKK